MSVSIKGKRIIIPFRTDDNTINHEATIIGEDTLSIIVEYDDGRRQELRKGQGLYRAKENE